MSAPVFHEGERAVQRRAGVEAVAARRAAMVLPFVAPENVALVDRVPFVVVGARDERERVWASLLFGGAGFARLEGPRSLVLEARPHPDDPLAEALARPGAHVGILVLEPVTRTRARINGIAEPVAGGLHVRVQESFVNCQKQIRRRVPVGSHVPARPGARSGDALDERQRALLAAADTFFIASSHPERGADTSHRGGPPGFVGVADDGATVLFPDFRGNAMFQTLGNLAVDPRAGLLFLDWETGTGLQLTGRARTIWDGEERFVELAVEAVHEREGTLPQRWR